jgi:small redox-active disulfide protein 2
VSEDDVMQIKVDKHRVGIIGMRSVMEGMAEGYTERSEDKVQTELLKRLSKKNYIPNQARESYAKSFLREFKKFLGKPYDEEVSEGLEIRILGPGCAQCATLEQEVMAVMAEMNLAADIEHVRDMSEIRRYGVMATPALVINGKVKCAGRVPGRATIKEWLNDSA